MSILTPWKRSTNISQDTQRDAVQEASRKRVLDNLNADWNSDKGIKHPHDHPQGPSKAIKNEPIGGGINWIRACFEQPEAEIANIDATLVQLDREKEHLLMKREALQALHAVGQKYMPLLNQHKG